MSADDLIEIQQLAATYADAMCQGEVHRAVVATYAPDGRLETDTTEPAVGHDAIEAVISAAIANLELIFQTVHLGVVRLDGDHARARFPITEWSRRASDAQPFLFLGWYEDEAVRLPDGWKFSRRRLVARTLARPDFVNGALLPLSALEWRC